MQLRISLMQRTLAVCSVLSLLGCAGKRIEPEGTGGYSGAGGGSGSGGPGGFQMVDAPIDRVRPNTDGRPERCDDAGECKCMNIGSLGKVAHYGGNLDSTDAFQAYLNTNSSARVTLLTNRTILTPELLADYDVIILQALSDSETNGFWEYSQAERDALAEWVRQGNGLIALTGYGADSREVNPANQLLEFAGISYGTTDTFTACPDTYCYCTESSIPFWNFSGFLSNHMDAPDGLSVGCVGVFHGRPVTCTDTADGVCEVVAADPSNSATVGVGKQIGRGRVFVWNDEWVTYTSQWGGGTTPHGQDCAGRTAAERFNVPQFWYNVIHWTLPDASCFIINDPQVVP